MFEKLEIFRIAHAMASHAGARQAVIAQNMANADTPGYAARDVRPFSELVSQDGSKFVPRATRAGHLNGPSLEFEPRMITRQTGEMDPNGNSVSLEEEMLKAVDVKRNHDRAIAIYKSSLSVLRAAVGRR